MGLRTLTIAVCATGLLACGQIPKLPGGDAVTPPDPPKVSVSAVALVAAPSNTLLAKYFCPDVANSLVCRVFGSRPSQDELKFVFDVDLTVENPNKIPLPAVEAMVAFTAYPEAQSAANVGAVCVSLCPEDQVCGAPPADGCSDAGTLKSMNDYASAAVGFLANVALGNTTVSDVQVRTIPAGGSVNVKVRLELNPNAMLSLMSNVASEALASVGSGEVPSFVVPYLVEGTVWVNVESFGKIAAGFGPVNDSWALAQ